MNSPLQIYITFPWLWMFCWQCKSVPEKPLYNGGIFKDQAPLTQHRIITSSDGSYTQALILQNLAQNTMYCFSS
jgi:hypothetical protein